MKDFDQIRARTVQRKGGEAALREILGPQSSSDSVAGMSDDRLLSAMSKRIFCAGFVWRVIENKWADFEQAFLGFEPVALLFQPEDFWQDLASDKRIVRNAQKIRAVRENADFVKRVSEENDGFGSFLAGWPADDQLGLQKYLGKHGSRLGGATGAYFLRWVGWDGYVLSPDVVAALVDAGLKINPKPGSSGDLRLIQQQLNVWAKETGYSYSHISRILAMSIGENREPETLHH